MNRIVCDICGTTYHESVRQCPICGSKCPDIENMTLADSAYHAPADQNRKGGRYAMTKEQKKKQETNPVPVFEQPAPQEWVEERPSRGHPILIALMVTLIFVLLVGTGVLYLRYYLPNQDLPEPDAQPPVLQEETEPTETEAPTIPCMHLALLSGGSVKLTQPGYKYLIHVATVPQDTTDKVVFTSLDESIATVTKEGRVTAVAEGTTSIVVSCGEQSFRFQVTCEFTTP